MAEDEANIPKPTSRSWKKMKRRPTQMWMQLNLKKDAWNAILSNTKTIFYKFIVSSCHFSTFAFPKASGILHRNDGKVFGWNTSWKWSSGQERDSRSEANKFSIKRRNLSSRTSAIFQIMWNKSSVWHLIGCDISDVRCRKWQERKHSRVRGRKELS